MTLYINKDTLEYPRYEGDVALNPEANWVEVRVVNTPKLKDNELFIELSPVEIDGIYTQQFIVREKTQEEIEREMESSKAVLERLEIPPA